MVTDGRAVVGTDSDTPRVKVLSIVGEGRSGSTVLAAILGELPGVFDAGELHWVWGRSLIEQRRCGCGRPPAECPVWSPVVHKTFGVPPAEEGRRPGRSSRTSASSSPADTGSGSCAGPIDRHRSGRHSTG